MVRLLKSIKVDEKALSCWGFSVSVYIVVKQTDCKQKVKFDIILTAVFVLDICVIWEGETVFSGYTKRW